MAIYHLNAKVISRGQGQSAIAAAAYRSGERLRDEQADEQKFYKARADRIQFTAILAPKDAPEWAYDRNRLWNEAERAERRKDAQLAREIEVSLPHELTPQQREWLVKDFAREAFTRHGYAVDIAIHAPDPGSDERNHHAHLMVTMRRLGPEGFAATKDRSLNGRAQLGAWREQWAELANRHLARHGHEARIDHRSLEAQGIDREATTHLGYAAKEIEARGGSSERVAELQGIKARNGMRAELGAIDAELQVLERAQAEIDRARQAEALAPVRPAGFTPSPPTPRPHTLPATKEGPTQTAKPQEPPGQWRVPPSPVPALRQDIPRQDTHAAQPKAPAPQQEHWQGKEAPSPRQARPPGRDSGLKVVDGGSRVVGGLGDVILSVLAGPSPAPARQGFTLDPAARKEQQLARLAERKAQEADREALNRMGEDMAAGRHLRLEDVQRLTHDHQILIRDRGDEGVRSLVEEAQRKARQDRGGDERERDR